MNSMRAILYTLLLPIVAWAQGYRLEPNQLIISESDWPGWNFPAGSVDFSDEGVRPHFVRRQINAALNAAAFSREDVTGGIRRAGTNFAGAAQLMDGLEETYWEPALDAPLRDWWVEVDLGSSGVGRESGGEICRRRGGRSVFAVQGAHLQRR